MESTPEQILETIEEVMSQKQFRFGETPSWDFSLPQEVGYVFLALITCAFIYLIYKIVRELYIPSVEKVKNFSTSEVKQEVHLEGAPIQQLHARILSKLQSQKVVTIGKWKTNTDYTVESDNVIFSDVCRLYDRAVYGSQVVPDETVELLRKSFEESEVQK